MIQNYIEEFKQLPQVSAPWWEELRKSSLSNFEKNGFPTQRLEEWKDTNLSPITSAYFKTPYQKSLSNPIKHAFWENDPHIVFHNGFCESINVNMDGVKIHSLNEAVTKYFDTFQTAFQLRPRYTHSFLDLNTSMAREGVAIHIEKNANSLNPIYLIYQSGSSAQAYHYRNLIIAEESSKVKIVEIFLSDDVDSDCWTIPVTQIIAKSNAHVEHVVLQIQNTSAYHTGIILGQLENHSRISTSSFVFGGKIVRNDIHMILNGEGSDCEMNGLYAVSGTQVVDHHTAVEHAKPHCTSSENYKGVILDQAHGIFEGKIKVDKQAQKTIAKQLNQNLLLSSQAKINTAPQLEILADDVKCSHGATIGKLDENQIFYLRSRGISRDNARQMLIAAYAGEIIDSISISNVKEELHLHLSKKIGAI